MKKGGHHRHHSWPKALLCALLAVVAVTLLSVGAPAAGFSGTVVGITDGDTIKVLVQGREVKVRLQGIDCPESNQAFGQRAKQFTLDLAAGETVTVIDQGKDRYGRTVGEVILPDGRSLNRELVRNGLAWWYKRYSDDGSLGELQREARDAGRGVWRAPPSVAPWDFRRGWPSSRSVQAWEDQGEEDTFPSDSSEETVYTTATGSKYHLDKCRYLRESASPIPLEQARGRYSPCSVCSAP